MKEGCITACKNFSITNKIWSSCKMSQVIQNLLAHCQIQVYLSPLCNTVPSNLLAIYFAVILNTHTPEILPSEPELYLFLFNVHFYSFVIYSGRTYKFEIFMYMGNILTISIALCYWFFLSNKSLAFWFQYSSIPFPTILLDPASCKYSQYLAIPNNVMILSLSNLVGSQTMQDPNPENPFQWSHAHKLLCQCPFISQQSSPTQIHPESRTILFMIHIVLFQNTTWY